ncbi:CPBP family intramembrane glutamic endopeptidase [Clostridium folliculivorans]|uniref:Protease n=1 Tax=Clostridium folliculivorans TaxID=2886038 RepID=A0A9W5Y324_9CLOT|nr:type II CAAX endopeptidase family protein [Clostridium folliculivorans]GKU25643.1 protease [Clostridium folliculivorans]GKU28665.1 protease [Clostridium folliculivorans]
MANYFKDNRLINDSKSGIRSTPLILVVVLSFVFVFLSQILGGILLGLMFFYAKIPFRQESIIGSNYIMILTTSLSIIICFLWIYLYEKRKPMSLGFHRSGLGSNYIYGFLLGLLLMSLEAVFLCVTNNAEISKGNFTFYNLLSFLVVIVSWIIQGASEEILIRGFALQAIIAKYNVLVGVLVSSLIFAALHLFNPGISLLAFINLILFGIIAALLALYTESLWASCALHSAWNFAEGNIYGFLVSGTHASGNTLAFINYKANNLINGGLFGPEGGLADTLISIIAIVILIALMKKKNNSISSNFSL